MIPGEAALKIDGVGVADGAVCGQLDTAALHESACRHNDVGIVAGHGPRLRGHIAVHRCSSLNTAAEGHHSLPAAQRHRLNDVMAAFRGVGDAGEAQLFVDVGGKDRTLQGTGHHGGSQEQTLIEGRHQTQVCADLLPQTGGGQPVSAPLHALLGAADVAADGGQTAAGVFDETAYYHISAHIRRLNALHKFAVAVVHHDLDVRLDLLAEANQLPNLLHGEARAGGVALGALDGDELGALVDLGTDGIVVEGAVGLQVRLGVGNTVLLQRALALPDADDLLQRVIGCAHGGEQFISRQQVGGQGHGQGVGAAGNLRPHQRSLRVEHICIDPFQIVPALVIVAVAGGGGEVGGIYPIPLHGGQDLGLIVFRRLVDGVKPVPQLRNDPLSVFIDSRADAQLFVHGFHFHVLCSSFPKISSARSFRISGRVTTSPLASLPRISRVSPGEMP